MSQIKFFEHHLKRRDTTVRCPATARIIRTGIGVSLPAPFAVQSSQSFGSRKKDKVGRVESFWCGMSTGEELSEMDCFPLLRSRRARSRDIDRPAA